MQLLYICQFSAQKAKSVGANLQSNVGILPRLRMMIIHFNTITTLRSTKDNKSLIIINGHVANAMSKPGGSWNADLRNH